MNFAKYSSLFLGTAMAASTLSFAAAEPRIPITCTLDYPHEVYESLQFDAFLKASEINYSYVLTNKDGITEFMAKGSQPVDTTGKEFEVSITNATAIKDVFGNVSHPGNPPYLVSIPSEILTSAAPQKARLGTRTLTCALFKAYIGVNGSYDFNQFNLPAVPLNSNPKVKVKSWTSSDGRLSLKATFWPDAPGTTHLPFVPSFTSLDVSLGGAVIDGQEDHPDDMGYFFYNPNNYFAEKKIMQAKLESAKDVDQIQKIFGSDKVTLDLRTVPYGEKDTPVQLVIDCSAGNVCLVTASN